VLEWTPLGTVDAGAIADVDGADWCSCGARRGASTGGSAPRTAGTTLREAAVRQQALGDAPVLETAMRVPGGDVVHRAFAVRASSAGADGPGWDDSAVVVEVENLSAVPVALAFAVRPVTLSGSGRIGTVRSDGPVVRVDGRVALVLSRAPSRAAHGEPGEPAELLAREDDVDAGSLSVDAGPGGLEVAYVVPLPHAATVRVLLPRPAAPASRRLFRLPQHRPSRDPGGTHRMPGRSCRAGRPTRAPLHVWNCRNRCSRGSCPRRSDR
jgi:hypothetical protein